MKPVVQLERTGCGIASVAALAGVSYKDVKRAANRLRIDADDSRLRASPQETPFASWSALPDLALLATKWHRKKGRAFWHWVVFVRDSAGAYVLDSKLTLKRRVRRDFRRMKPKWYITVK